jgi:hypothetical protein
MRQTIEAAPLQHRAWLGSLKIRTREKGHDFDGVFVCAVVD